MKKLKTFGLAKIKSWNPCYDPLKYIKPKQRHTVLTILNHPIIPFHNKLWCILRTELISERTMRLFAVYAYRQTLKFITNPDPRSTEAANVAERFANGKASDAELDAARSAGRSAERTAATKSAAWSAWSAAESAEREAAWSARSAAWAAAWAAATRSEEESEEESTEEAALNEDLKNKLIEMIKEDLI